MAISLNQQLAKTSAFITATTAECMKTDVQVCNCIVHMSDDTQYVKAFTVSEDGQNVMSENS